MTTKFIRTILLASIILSGCNTTSNQLVGAWRFVADQQVDASNRVTDEDRNVDGLLVYSQTGQMSVQLIWFSRREPFMSDSIMRSDGVSTGVGLGRNSWTEEENRVWIDTYDAYFGRYEIDQERNIVRHSVNGNLRPEKKKTEYERSFSLRGDTLYLMSTDTRQRWRTVWIRQ